MNQRYSGLGRTPPLVATVVDASELSVKDQDRWNLILRESGAAAEPGSNPCFVRAVGARFPETKVGILSREGNVVGYVAFSLKKGACAFPVPLCDHQPVILPLAEKFHGRDVVRALGLSKARLENLKIPGARISGATEVRTAREYRICRQDDFETYVKDLINLQKSPKRGFERIRIVERDLGKLHFQHGVKEEFALDRLLALKAEKYGVGGTFPDSVRSLLLACMNGEVSGLEGKISILRSGHVEIAYIYWLKIGRIAYYWFPTFDPAYKKYSPGLIGLWRLIEDLPQLGCDVINLGPGGEAYKVQFANDFEVVTTVDIHASWLRAQTTRGAHLLMDGYRSVPAAKRLVRYMRGLIES